MQAKHVVFFLVVYAVTACFASSLLKKRKLQVQPHGRHVADESSSTGSAKQHGLMRHNSPPPSNERETLEKSKTTVAKKKKDPTSLSVEEKRKLRLKKKRKQWKKSMRSLGLKEKSLPLKRCKGWSDCGPSECCIRHGRRGFCKKRPQKWQRCKPRLRPGLDECPCQTGLTCTHFRTNRYGYKKYQCEVLRHNDDEREQP